jgi:hypothetical protein
VPGSISRGNAASGAALIWHGTQTESQELIGAITRYCVCPPTAADGASLECAPHRMLLTDQRALNGLVFARRIADQLRTEEFRAPSPVFWPGSGYFVPNTR